jgi:hypothetical protein
MAVLAAAQKNIRINLKEQSKTLMIDLRQQIYGTDWMDAIQCLAHQSQQTGILMLY